MPTTATTTPAPPLVLHVIPTTLARGGQREARALADQLDAAGVRLHRLLTPFDGPPDVVADYSLDHRVVTAPAVGSPHAWSAGCARH